MAIFHDEGLPKPYARAGIERASYTSLGQRYQFLILPPFFFCTMLVCHKSYARAGIGRTRAHALVRRALVCACAAIIVRLCAAAAYMVVAGHEERSRDDHCQRMLEMAKVQGDCVITFDCREISDAVRGTLEV